MISSYKCQKGRDKTYTCVLGVGKGEKCETSFQRYLNWVVRSINIWSERGLLFPGHYRHLEKYTQRHRVMGTQNTVGLLPVPKNNFVYIVYIVALRERYPYCSTSPLRKTILDSGAARDKRQDHGELDTLKVWGKKAFPKLSKYFG